MDPFMNGHHQPDLPRSLYVGNLDPSVTEELILAMFGQIGPVKSCKIIREAAFRPIDPYCFVEFSDYVSANAALTAMNRRVCLGREMRVNWAAGTGSSSGSGDKPQMFAQKHSSSWQRLDASQPHQHIFIGDLSLDVDTDSLRAAFAPFGEISDCRVMKEPETNKSKGYGFVSFVEHGNAQRAIDEMNGQWLGSRAMRTNWATRKPVVHAADASSHRGDMKPKTLDYDTVSQQTSGTNCTVYCGGLMNCFDETIRKAFSSFGRIVDVRFFRDKGYAFIKYDNKESACSAIVALHGSKIADDGANIKCSWGKEDPHTSAAATDSYAVHQPEVQQFQLQQQQQLQEQPMFPGMMPGAAGFFPPQFAQALYMGQPQFPQYFVPNPQQGFQQQW